MNHLPTSVQLECLSSGVDVALLEVLLLFNDFPGVVDVSSSSISSQTIGAHVAVSGGFVRIRDSGVGSNLGGGVYDCSITLFVCLLIVCNQSDFPDAVNIL